MQMLCPEHDISQRKRKERESEQGENVGGFNENEILTEDRAASADDKNSPEHA